MATKDDDIIKFEGLYSKVTSMFYSKDKKALDKEKYPQMYKLRKFVNLWGWIVNIVALMTCGLVIITGFGPYCPKVSKNLPVLFLFYFFIVVILYIVMQYGSKKKINKSKNEIKLWIISQLQSKYHYKYEAIQQLRIDLKKSNDLISFKDKKSAFAAYIGAVGTLVTIVSSLIDKKSVAGFIEDMVPTWSNSVWVLVWSLMFAIPGIYLIIKWEEIVTNAIDITLEDIQYYILTIKGFRD